MALSRATRKKLILLGVALAMAAGVATLWGVRQVRLKGSLERDRRQGIAAYEAGDYEKAISHLSRYVGRRRNDADVLLAFADARRQVPSNEGTTAYLRQALAVTRLALDLDPDSAKGRVMLMEIAGELGLLTEANDAAEAVLQQDPKNRDAHLIQLFAARNTGRDEDCIRIAKEMATQLPEDFEVQDLALRQLIQSKMPLEDLRAYVKEQRRVFEGRITAELLAATFARYELSVAVTAQERKSHQEELLGHLTMAGSLRPEEPAEARMLISFLDASPGLGREISAEDLLDGYLADPNLADGVLAFALARAWQRNDPALIANAAIAHPDASTLDDEALGWLTLGLPDELRLREELGRRESQTAEAWKRIMLAADHAEAREIVAAREAVAPLLTSDEPTISTMARYINAIGLQRVGEVTQAERQLEDLAVDPFWVRARTILHELAFERGDFERALALLRVDMLPETRVRELEAAVSLDEMGYQWPEGLASGRVLTDRALMIVQNEPALLALHGRAELAAGMTARALEVADQLVAIESDRGREYVRGFAARLTAIDPARADALRAAYPATTDDPIATVMEELQGSEASVSDIRARIEAVTAEATPEIRLQGRLMIAGLLDQTGDPAAAAEYQGLSEEHPSDTRVQRAALDSNALWTDLSAVEPVVGRLRSITGEDGVVWRIYDHKLSLIQDDSEAAAAQAVIGLSDILRLAPRDLLALQLMAEALSRSGDLERAASYANRAADAAPGDLMIALNSVDTFARAGLTEEARTRLVDSVQIQGAPVRSRLRRAILLGRYGLVAQALEDWAWLAQNGDSPAKTRAALVLAQAGRQDEASEIVDELLTLDDQSIEVRSALADALAALGRRNEGLALLEELEILEGTTDRDELIALFLARHAESPEEFGELDAFVRATDSAEAWTVLIQTYMGRGMIEEARHTLADAVVRGWDASLLAPYERALDPEMELDPEAYLAVARSSVSLLDIDWARDLSDQLDLVISGENTLDQFVAYLEGFVKARPEIPLGWMLMGQAQASLDDHSGARATTQRMLEAVPTDPRAALAAVNLFRRMQMADEGLLAARAYASRLGAPTRESGVTIAQFALLAGRSQEAWTAIAPWRAELQSSFERGLYARAALLTDRTDQAAAIVWGWEEADEAWTIEAIRMGALITDSVERRAWLETASQRALDPDDETRLSLAAGWYDLGINTGDMVALEQAFALTEPDAADPMIEGMLSRLQGACHSIAGRKSDAIISYRRAVELVPDDPDALNNLAFLLLEHGGDADASLDYARRAVEVLQKRDAAAAFLTDYLDTLGLALLRTGRPEEALATFDEVLSTRPEYAYSVIGRSEALAELGRFDEARAAIDGLDNVDASLTDRLNRLRSRLDPP